MINPQINEWIEFRNWRHSVLIHFISINCWIKSFNADHFIIITVILANLKADEIYEIRLEWAKNSQIQTGIIAAISLFGLIDQSARMFWRNELLIVQFQQTKNEIEQQWIPE